jgi:hypothetical protein
MTHERFFALQRSSSSVSGGAVVTSKAEEYRAKARECEENAEKTRDSVIKQRLIELAQQWRTLAAHEEKNAR